MKEAEYCRKLLDNNDYSMIKRFSSLKNKVESRLSGENCENESLFELRVADAFREEAQNIEYEYPTLNGSSVDFFCEYGEHKWFIEAVSVCTSDAVKSAGISSFADPEQKIPTIETILSSDRKDQRQTTAGEMIKVQEKIGEKVFDGKKENKFYVPKEDELNVIVVDMRGYNLGLLDEDDVRQLCFGNTKIHPVQRYNGNCVKGLFDQTLDKKYAILVQKQIHYIIFVKENFSSRFYPERGVEIPSQIGFDQHFIVPNPHLITKQSIVFPFNGVSRK